MFYNNYIELHLYVPPNCSIMQNTKTCELCFGQILNNYEKLDFDTIRNIRSLLNLDITASEETIICSKCANICQKSYNFKTTCLSNNDYLKTLNHSNEVNKLILEDVIVKDIKTEVKSEEEKVCYCCLNYFETTSMEVKVEQDVFIKEMLEKCLPELDISAVENPLVCFNCTGLLKECFDFISCCKATVLVKNLNKNSSDVDTNAMLPKTENVDYTTDYNVIKTEKHIEESIETKYHINTEVDLDIEEDDKEFLIKTLKESDNHLKEIDDEALTSSSIVKRKERKYACTLCPYRSKDKYTLKNRSQVHQELTDTVRFKCDKCLYVTSRKPNLINHSLRHKNPSELTMFKCEKCPFKTKRKGNLRNHRMIHKNPSELPLHKCAKCSFQTWYKSSLLRHRELHLKADESSTQNEVFICNDCAFMTKSKGSLVAHVNRHLEVKAKQFTRSKNLSNSLETVEKNPSDNSTEFFSCALCLYSKPLKSNLVNHHLTHKTLKYIRQFKCDKCSFVGKRKSDLVEHQRVHHDITERKRYKCPECLFEALSRPTMTRHKKIVHEQTHEKWGELKRYICHECGFGTTYRNSILGHLEVHRQGKTPRNEYRQQWFRLSKATVEDIGNHLRMNTEHNPVKKRYVKPKPHGKIKEKKFVCDLCSYRTTSNRNLKLHYPVHKEPREVNLFKCDYCPFATKWKNNLRNHLIRHKNPSELPKFKCYDCPYETNIKRYLVKHVKHGVHKNSSGMPNNEWKQPAKSDQNLKKVGQHNPVEEKDVKLKPRGKIKEKKFVCDKCSYQTTFNSHLKQHYIIHKEPSEANLFKCDYCAYATNYKSNIRKHVILHKNPSELPKFKCNDCAYETIFKPNLVSHVLAHKTPSQVRMYKCKVCPFQTNYRCAIRIHEKSHQVETYTCDECSFKSKFKHCLMAHLRCHKWTQPASTCVPERDTIKIPIRVYRNNTKKM